MDPKHLEYLKIRLQYDLNNTSSDYASFFELPVGDIERIFVRNAGGGGSLAPVPDRQSMHDDGECIFHLEQNGSAPDNFDPTLAWDASEFLKKNYPLNDEAVGAMKHIYLNVKKSFATPEWNDFFKQEREKARLNGTELTDKFVQARIGRLIKAYFFQICKKTLFETELSFKDDLQKRFFTEVCGSNIIKNMFNSFLDADKENRLDEISKKTFLEEFYVKGTGLNSIVNMLRKDSFNDAISSTIPQKVIGNGFVFMMGEEAQNIIAIEICELMMGLPKKDMVENFHKVLDAIDRGKTAPYEYKAFVKSRFISMTLKYTGEIDIPRKVILKSILDDPNMLNEILNMPKDQLIAMSAKLSHDWKNKASKSDTVEDCQKKVIQAIHKSIFKDYQGDELADNINIFFERLDKCSAKGILTSNQDGLFSELDEANEFINEQKNTVVKELIETNQVYPYRIAKMILEQQECFDFEELDQDITKYIGGDPSEKKAEIFLEKVLEVLDPMSVDIRKYIGKYDEIYKLIQKDPELEDVFFKNLYHPDMYDEDLANSPYGPASNFQSKFTQVKSLINSSTTQLDKKELQAKHLLYSLQAAKYLEDFDQQRSVIVKELFEQLLLEPKLLTTLINSRKDLVINFINSNFESSLDNDADIYEILSEFSSKMIYNNTTASAMSKDYDVVAEILENSSLSEVEVAKIKAKVIQSILLESYDSNEQREDLGILRFRNEQFLNNALLIKEYNLLQNEFSDEELTTTISNFIESQVKLRYSEDDILKNYKRICNMIDRQDLSELNVEERASLKVQYLTQAIEKYDSDKIREHLIKQSLVDAKIREVRGTTPEKIFDKLLEDIKETGTPGYEKAIEQYNKYSNVLDKKLTAQNSSFIKIKYLMDVGVRFGATPEWHLFYDIEFIKDQKLIQTYDTLFRDAIGASKDRSMITVIQKVTQDLYEPSEPKYYEKIIENAEVILNAIENKAYPDTKLDEEGFEKEKSILRRNFASTLIVKEANIDDLEYVEPKIPTTTMGKLGAMFKTSMSPDIKYRLQKHELIMAKIDHYSQLSQEHKNQLKLDYLIEYLKFEKTENVLTKSPIIKTLLNNLYSKENVNLLAHISKLPEQDRQLIASTTVEYFSVSKAKKAIGKANLQEEMQKTLVNDLDKELRIKKEESKNSHWYDFIIKAINDIKSNSQKSNVKDLSIEDEYVDIMINDVGEHEYDPTYDFVSLDESIEQDKIFENQSYGVPQPLEKDVEEELSEIIETLVDQLDIDEFIISLKEKITNDSNITIDLKDLIDKIQELAQAYEKYTQENDGDDFSDFLASSEGKSKAVRGCIEYIIENDHDLEDMQAINEKASELVNESNLGYQ